MKRDRPLSDFIKTNGVYQSTTKLEGEMHAACFMYGTSWKYICFQQGLSSFLSFSSSYDLRYIEKIKQKVKVPNLTLMTKYKWVDFKRESWEDGTFAFKQMVGDEIPKHYYGHFRKDYITEEDELLIIGQGNFTDVYKFIEFRGDLKLEFELLKLFSTNKYVTATNVPNFGQTDIEEFFIFEKFKLNKYIQSNDNHLDYLDFYMTSEGEKYFEYLKELKL